MLVVRAGDLSEFRVSLIHGIGMGLNVGQAVAFLGKIPPDRNPVAYPVHVMYHALVCSDAQLFINRRIPNSESSLGLILQDDIRRTVPD